MDDVFDGLVKKRNTKMATGAKQSTEQTPSVTTVITAQDIEAIGATDLDDVLKMVPGLHVSKNYVLNNSIYAIRGMHSTNNPEVLALINGIPIKTLFFSNRNRAWGGMPVNSIARIEIVRGPVNMSRCNMDASLDISKDNWQFRTGYQGRRDMGVGVGTSQVLDSDGRYEADRINADLTYHNPILTKYWDVTAQASHYDDYKKLSDLC